MKADSNNKKLNKRELNKRFIEAVKSQNIEDVETLLDLGAKINSKDRYGYSSIHNACLSENIEIVKLLAKRGVDLNQKNKVGSSILHILAAKGSKNFLTIIKILIKAGADVNSSSKQGTTPIWNSIMWKQEETVRLLIKLGADVNWKSAKKESVLQYAIRIGNKKIIEILKKSGAKLYDSSKKMDKRELEGKFFAAIESKNLEDLKKLIKLGIDVNSKDSFGFPALHLSVINGDIEIVKLLINSKVDLEQKDDYNGASAIHMVPSADTKKYLDIIKLLIEKGADLESKSKRGETIIEVAKRLKNKKLIKLLESHTD